MQDHKNLLDRYTINETRMLGQGSYATVYLGHVKRTNQKVAIKRISLSQLKRHNESIQSIKQETQILKQLNHPNIVRFIDYIELKESNYLYIVMEYCNNGTFKNLIEQRKSISSDQILDMLKQLVNGFEYMMSSFKNRIIIHRDIKPQNILVHEEIKGKKIYKIADFGFSRFISQHNQMMTSILGTPLYMSPQIHEGSQYSAKSDIFSLGVTLFEIFYGMPPWIANNQEQLLRNIKKNSIDKIFNETRIKELMQKKISSNQQNKDEEQQIFFCNLVLIKCLQYKEKERISWEGLFDLVDQINIQRNEMISKNILYQLKQQYIFQMSYFQQFLGFLAIEVFNIYKNDQQVNCGIIFLIACMIKISYYIYQIIDKEVQINLKQFDDVKNQMENQNFIYFGMDQLEFIQQQNQIQFLLDDLQVFLNRPKYRNNSQYISLLKFLEDVNYDIDFYDMNALKTIIQDQFDSLEEKDQNEKDIIQKFNYDLGKLFDKIGIRFLIDMLMDKLDSHIVFVKENVLENNLRYQTFFFNELDQIQTYNQLIFLLNILNCYDMQMMINTRDKIQESYQSSQKFKEKNKINFDNQFIELYEQCVEEAKK